MMPVAMTQPVQRASDASSPATSRSGNCDSRSPGATREPFFVHRALRVVESVLRAAGVTAQPVLVAVSGGGDSMALLELVSMLAPALALDLHVACIDHGVRPEAAGEVESVRRAAARCGARFHTRQVHAKRTDEDSLRRARHEALASVADAAGCRFILLGHTSDDQIETIVFRFLRGAGFGGLAGIRTVRGRLVRPLLAIRREELRRVLCERGVAWAEDATNTGERHARGRLRTVVLPAIASAFGAGSLEHLLDVAQRWRDDDDFLEAEAARVLERASGDPVDGSRGASLDVAILAGVHRALRARALRRWLVARTGVVPSSRELAGIERWLDRRRGASTIDIAGGRLLQSRGRLHLSAAMPTRPLDEASVPVDGASVPVDGASVPLDEASVPLDEASVPLDSHVVEREIAPPTSGGDERSADAARGDNVHAIGRDGLLPPSDGRVRFSRT